MKQLFITILITLSSIITIFAQQQESTAKSQENENVKVIEYNYRTQSFVKNKTFKRLKVYDWVSVKISNLPDSAKVGYNVIFTNRNLEQLETFSSYFGFNKNTKTNWENIPENPNTDLNDLNNQDTLNTNITAKKVKKDKQNVYSDNNDENNNLTREFILNENSMKADLELGYVNRFLKNVDTINMSVKDKAERLKAINDVNWQKKLIGYLQDNLKFKLDIRNTAIDDLNKIIEGYKISNPSNGNNTLNLPLVQIDNFDHTQFNIKIEKSKVQTEDLLITLPYHNKFGFKLDFSTGIIANNLLNPTYTLEDGNNNTKIIREENSSLRYNLGLGLLCHAYTRLCTFVSPSITTGVVVNFNSQNLNYVLGTSVLLGNNQRFILSGGLILGKVKDLPSHINSNQEYDISYLGSSIPITEKFKNGFWFGITYNLGSNNKEKTIQF